VAKSEISERLSAIRDELHLSQRALASLIGVAYRTWQDIETGKNVPSGETLLKVAKLGFNPGWILMGVGAMRLDEPSQAGHAQAGDELIGPALDHELFGRIVDAITRLYKAENISLSPVDLGRLSSERYEEIRSAASDMEGYLVAIKMMIGQLRKELHATRAEPSTGKRSA
jgi:transcriptional regulator with XRE-family HTH domain